MVEFIVSETKVSVDPAHASLFGSAHWRVNRDGIFLKGTKVSALEFLYGKPCYLLNGDPFDLRKENVTRNRLRSMMPSEQLVRDEWAEYFRKAGVELNLPKGAPGRIQDMENSGMVVLSWVGRQIVAARLTMKGAHAALIPVAEWEGRLFRTDMARHHYVARFSRRDGSMDPILEEILAE